jgi:hypothetical protein
VASDIGEAVCHHYPQCEDNIKIRKVGGGRTDSCSVTELVGLLACLIVFETTSSGKNS